MSGTRSNDWVGRTLAGRYLVTERIGFGGMGVVFKATDTRLGVQRAIKVPHFVLDDDGELTDRFVHEVQALVELTHPHIIGVVDTGEHDGTPFAVMQYLPGGSLAERHRPSSPSDVIEWLPDIADALDFVHARGLAHRDVKPGNILFDSSGRAYLGDFGITKFTDDSDLSMPSLTTTGGVIGTPAYMAPEVLLPERFTSDHSHQSRDQYALGVTAYEMLAGQLPFRGSSLGEISVSVATEEAPSLQEQVPSLPRGVSDSIARALLKQPKNRFKNCREFARAFVDAVDGQQRVKPVQQRSHELERPPLFVRINSVLQGLESGKRIIAGSAFLCVTVFCLVGLVNRDRFLPMRSSYDILAFALLIGVPLSASLGLRLVFGEKGCFAAGWTLIVLLLLTLLRAMFL